MTRIIDVNPAAVHGCRPPSGENLPDKAKSARCAQCFLSIRGPEASWLMILRGSTWKSFDPVPEKGKIFKSGNRRLSAELLPLIFPFGDPFQHSEPRFLCIRN